MNIQSTSPASTSHKHQHKPIIIVQGAQFGSEAKGMVAAALCEQRNIAVAVRTGGVNAGHTVYYSNTRTTNPVAYKMQQLPTGWVNPSTVLVIGAGAFIDPVILDNELKLISAATDTDATPRVLVDYRAAVHLPHHQHRAKIADRHHKMGATGKGCSEAFSDKIRTRGSQERFHLIFYDWLQAEKRAVIDAHSSWIEENQEHVDRIARLGGLSFTDTSAYLNKMYDNGHGILIEGTQGTLLDINLGPWPFTTHKPTTAAQWVVEAGLSPALKYEVILVARTFPIRVAGNSGPMKHEASWPEVARQINWQLQDKGLPERVNELAIRAFESACHSMANSGQFHLPRDRAGAVRYDFHQFNPDEREAYRVAISELHAEAMKLLPPDIVKELSRLFEFTTVTKKLRRVAHLNIDELATACTINRPGCVVLTFLNYLFPEVWGITSWRKVLQDGELATRILQLLHGLEAAIGCRIEMVSTGPLAANLLNTTDLYNPKFQAEAAD